MGALNSRAKDDPGWVNTSWMADVAKLVSQQTAPAAMVLLRGESGVGKDLAARVIHAASERRAQPFIKVTCATRPQSRLESDLFGHEKGTTASSHRRVLSRFEFANRGILFLDEIDALPRALVPRIFDVLGQGKVVRVGGREPIRVDVWVLASTKRSSEGTRSDILWEGLLGLKVVEIRIPPLRERKQEIPALASFFLSTFNQRYHRHTELLPETIALFTEYAWPGNVRELEEIVRRLVVTRDAIRIHREIAAHIERYRFTQAIA